MIWVLDGQRRGGRLEDFKRTPVYQLMTDWQIDGGNQNLYEFFSKVAGVRKSRGLR